MFSVLKKFNGVNIGEYIEIFSGYLKHFQRSFSEALPVSEDHLRYIFFTMELYTPDRRPEESFLRSGWRVTII